MIVLSCAVFTWIATGEFMRAVTVDLCDECIETNSAAEEEYCRAHAKDVISE